jgi:uncharacterized membrane protein YccC
MIDGFSGAQIIGGLIAVLVALLAAFFVWIVRRFDRLEEKNRRCYNRRIAARRRGLSRPA